MDELAKAFEEAWSLENRQAHTEDDTEVSQIGIRDRGNRRYVLFKDTSGNYWYKTMIKTNGIYVPEEEAIFGTKKKAGWSRRRI